MLSLLVFCFGLCIGSFLNVVIYRLPVMLDRQWHAEALAILGLDDEMVTVERPRLNLAYPASACPHCGAAVRFWQNIPVISFLLLRGRCYSCRNPISVRYPLVELLAALLSVLVFLKVGLTWQLPAMLLLLYVSIALIGIDVDHCLLPDVLTLPLLWLGLLLNTQALFVSLPDAVWGAALGYSVLWVVFWLFKLITGKEGMGFGDFKLLAAYGAWFGWQVLPNIVLLSSLAGALWGLSLIFFRGRDSQVPMPFGPFIAAAALATAFFPDYVVIFDLLG